MPVLSGKEIFILLKEIDPNVKVIVTSGYEQDDRVSFTMGHGAMGFLRKPYTLITYLKFSIIL